MSEQPFDPSSVSPPSVPPTQAGPLPTATPPSTWPTAIGVIAIVFGAGGILATLMGLVSMLFMNKFLQSVDKEQAAIIQAAQPEPVVALVMGLLGLMLAAVLLAGGIGVVKRCLWGVRACRAWAILKLILVVCNTWLGYVMQQKVIEAMSQQSSSGPAVTPPPVFAFFGVCIGLVWGIALPVFMLIWFSRARIKEEINGWKVDTANPYRQGVR